ncbi:polysaccharide deacetylase family protein [Cohnella hashimotonis]|uniref:Polysaccharide deacetylase family protein n=1 Tax=Cohnella hashimotonis TaxID=2826895 RepID=A0ABT6TQ80_9BACL|nr:polysaccharide deacetylase family protein [Cohnella hashimotonis]MDI4648884.1 polysaccharide deacetylase family protein [Cohnella hashimotonis]
MRQGKASAIIRRLAVGTVAAAILLATPVALAAEPMEKAEAVGYKPAFKGRSYYESRGEAIWEVPLEGKFIALTFDDGPDPADTPAILDLLAKYGAHATFFITGKKAEQYPGIVKREAMEGHEVANHTYTHRMLLHCSDAQIRSEIAMAQKSITLAAGTEPVLFRPPEGFFNARVLSAGREQGLMTVLWSWHHPTDDWARPGVSHIVKGILGDVRSGDIVLLHDYVSGKTQTIDALRVILPKLTEEGYRFVTVSELLQLKNSKTNLVNR